MMTPQATRAIHVDTEVYNRLAEIKLEIEEQSGTPATFNDAAWRALGLQTKTGHRYATKPGLHRAHERGYDARVFGRARQSNPYRDIGCVSRSYRRAWFEGWDLANDRSKGHLITTTEEAR